MTTIAGQILLQLDAVLKAAAPVGTNVYRGRADAESRAEAPAINVLLGGHTSEPFSDDLDRHELVAELRFYVRDDDVLLAAEALHEAVHSAIVTDATLLQLAVSVRHRDATGDPAEADLTALHKAVRYHFIFTCPKGAL